MFQNRRLCFKTVLISVGFALLFSAASRTFCKNPVNSYAPVSGFMMSRISLVIIPKGKLPRRRFPVDCLFVRVTQK